MRNIMFFALIVSAAIVAFILVLSVIDWWLSFDESLSDVLNNAVKEDEDYESAEDVNRLINAISKIGGDSNRWMGD
jgi:hypothetical protein